MNIGELVNRLTEWKDEDPQLMGRRVRVFLSSSDGAEERELDIESACIEDDPAQIFVNLDEGRKRSRWAEQIAARISDEWCGKEDNPEAAALLETILTEALCRIPEARLMELVGTGIIEEDYFDDLDMSQEIEALGFKEFHTGGGCTAYRKDSEEGGYILITNKGAEIPRGGERVLVGRYDSQDEVLVCDEYDSLSEYIASIEGLQKKDKGQKKGRGGNPSRHAPNRRKGGE